MWLALGAEIVLAAAGMYWMARRSGTRAIARRLDELQAQVATWQRDHRARIRALERQMRGIELAAARAEEDARYASVAMGRIRLNLVGQLERVEQEMEIRLLVDQGRIPEEFLPGCEAVGGFSAGRGEAAERGSPPVPGRLA